MPVKEIEKRLEENQDINYISTLLPGQDRYNWYRKLYEVRYPTWINKDTVTVKAFKHLYKTVTGGSRHTFKLFKKQKPFEEDLVFGSQWWTLRSEAAFEILQYSDAHPEVLEYFKDTIIPDECFFQTLFMMGTYRDKRRASLTFSYVERNRRHPVMMTEKEYEKIKEAETQMCFARKFDDKSQGLIQMIENNGMVTH
jgi:hypothetical protein